MRNKYLPLLVFLLLLLSSLCASHYSYHATRQSISADLNQALKQTLKDKGLTFITTDTIRAYKDWQRHANGQVEMAIADDHFCQSLHNARLREAAFISFAVVNRQYREQPDYGSVCGDTLLIKDATTGETLALRSYARLSAGTIFNMSDQRLPSFLFFLSLLWATSALFYARRRNVPSAASDFGGLTFSVERQCFCNARQEAVHLTPMQFRLMEMFWNSPGHMLTKTEICQALWPRKDNPNDTFYTLIKRFKSAVEANSNLEITVDRGRSYTLRVK